MNINDLIERVSKFDNSLAKDLSEYVRGREYGLVFEASKPEFVRLWNKPVVRGDLVNVLPPRGVMEDTKNDDDPSNITYRFVKKDGNKAVLCDIKTRNEIEANLDDLVSIARFDQPIYCGLKEIDRVERGANRPYNVVINGENFHALQTLAYAYAGKVDCIYIDPPYNTGAKDWKYNNNYVCSDDVYRHSKWLTFMEDRLKVAKRLLNPRESVLIVTIDEKEYLRLGMLLEQIFPNAKIQMITSMTNKKGQPRDGIFSRCEEYIYYVFIGNGKISRTTENMLFAGTIENGQVKKKMPTIWNSLLRRGTGAAREDSPTLFYPIFVNENTKTIIRVGEPLPLEVDRNTVVAEEGEFVTWPMHKDGTEGRWQMKPDTLRKYLKDGTAKLGQKDKKSGMWSIVYLKRKQLQQVASGEIVCEGRDEHGALILHYPDEHNEDSAALLQEPRSLWVKESHDASVYGSTLIKGIVPANNFTFPKSLYAVEDTLRFIVKEKKDALIVDFFAGSGTTLHAVNLLNAEDGGNRRCICVTNNEVSVDEQKKFTKKMLRQGDEEWEKYGIANYVTWPRTKCSINGVNTSGAPLTGEYFSSGALFSDGFDANAVFFELTYLEPSLVSANLAYNEIAPILWLRSGCYGNILSYNGSYVIGEKYAILFDYSFINQFIDEVKNNKNISHAFIVTDIKNRYRNLCAELPGRDVVQLYESYLRSFEINTEV